LISGISLFCVTAVVVGIYVWRTFTYVKTVRAKVWGAVIPLSAGADGRLLELPVKPGERVTEGQLLARLDDSELRAAFVSAEAAQRIKESQYAQAQATAQLTEATVRSAIQTARVHVDAAARRVDNAQAAFDLRTSRLVQEIRGATARVEEAKARLESLTRGSRSEQIEAAKARLASAKSLQALYALEVEQSQQLVQEGIDSKYTLEVKKTQLARQENEVQTAELALAELQAGPREEEIRASQQVLEARQSELVVAQSGQKEVDVLAAELAIRKAELTEAQAAVIQAEAHQAEVTVANEQVKVADAELERAKADVDGRRAALNSMSIVSPVNGTVIRTFDRVGEICRAGVQTIQVVDDSRGRWIEGYVREKDAARVRQGQKAQAEMIIGSGNYVVAVVDAVGLSTSSVDRMKSTAASDTGQFGVSEMVWIKLVPVEQRDDVLPGMSARARVRVR
jgi:HlyD family secretion protein